MKTDWYYIEVPLTEKQKDELKDYLFKKYKCVLIKKNSLE